MAFLTDSVEGMRTLLKTAEEVAARHLKGRGENAVLTVFTIEGQLIQTLQQVTLTNIWVSLLGMKCVKLLCHPSRMSDGTLLKSMTKSLLAPWQKLNAMSTFIILRLNFLLQGANVEKNLLKKLIKQLKRWRKIG